jgi:hypothetical protein
MDQRDRLGLGDRLAGLARHRLDQLLELQRRRQPPRGGVEDLEVGDALLELLARPRQPREGEVDQQIGQRQQQEAERLLGIVEQREDHADRHQQHLGADARQRDLVEVAPPAAAEQAQPHALQRVVTGQQQAVDHDHAQRDRGVGVGLVVRVRPDQRIGTAEPAAQRDQPAGHPAEVQYVAELGPAHRALAALRAADVQPHRRVERQRDRDDPAGGKRSDAQRGRNVVRRVERQHGVRRRAKRQRARREHHDEEQRDPQPRCLRPVQTAQLGQPDHDRPPGEAERDREQMSA